MRPFGRLASLAVVALAAAVPAGAGTLTSGLVHAGSGSSGARARCFLTNVGSKPVTVLDAAILGLSGNVHELSGDNCTDAPLNPQATCLFVTEEGAYAGFGKVSVKGGTRNLRGRCQVLTPVDAVVHSESEMR
jgi:hypothetical protein